ncbi:MAG: ATP-binding protein [Syntrophorhabdaceae bacterium]
MATEITAEEAQANLERKRKTLGINPSTPSTSKKPSEIIEKTIGLIVPGECWRHKKPEPCPDCEQEAREAKEWAATKEREQQEQAAARREAQIKDRQDNPEKILTKLGVGKRHLFCSFENYREGDRIKAVCQDYLKDPFDLVLSGGAGSGKTHLAVSILRELVRSCTVLDGPGGYTGKDRRGCFMSVPELLAKIRATYSDPDGDEEGLIDTYASVKYLVLDDLGAEKSTEWSISTLYLIIDRRYREMLPTIVTTNLTMDEIAQGLSRRIASRLASGKVITIKAPDYRMKRTA